MPERRNPSSRSGGRTDRTRRHQSSVSPAATAQKARTSGQLTTSASVDQGTRSGLPPPSQNRRARNQTTLPPSPPPSQHKRYRRDTSYDLTSHVSAQSQYQSVSTPGLPSAAKWPHQTSIADKRSMDDDLLGLQLNHFKHESYSTTARIPEEDIVFPYYSETLAGGMDAGPLAGYGMTTYQSFRQEAVFAWHHGGDSLARRENSYDFVDPIDQTIL